MEEVFGRTKFSKSIYEKAARRLVETGGGVFSHTVGMAVHDVGSYDRDVLKAGQVFSIDPQLRVPTDNLYIRNDDVVVVTGRVLRTSPTSCPSELDAIEKLVGRGGMLQKCPPPPRIIGGSPKVKTAAANA